MSEVDPLLSQKDVYDRFTASQKRLILIMAGSAGIIGHGRRGIYLISLPVTCAGSIGVYFSKTVSLLFISRAFQALGASSLLSLGAATISDIYRVEERGAAIGIYFGFILLGFAVAPIFGGFISTISSWRITYLIVSCMNIIPFISMLSSLPETSHPGSRGIDKLSSEESHHGFRWVWLNPLRSLGLLRGYPYLAIVIAGAFTLLTDVVGAYISGRLSDKAVTAGRKRRGGEWVPEDRLLATIPGALFLAPLSVLVFGWTAQFVPGKVGLIVCLFAIFMNGLGVDIVLAPSNTYLVDILHTRSAEATSISSSFRLAACSLTSTAILPLIDTIGLGPTNTLAAILSLAGYFLIFLTIKYGKEMREWKDIGYTVRELEPI